MTFREERYEDWLKNPEVCKRHFERVLEKGVVSAISDTQTWSTRPLEKADYNLDFATPYP